MSFLFHEAKRLFAKWNPGKTQEARTSRSATFVIMSFRFLKLKFARAMVDDKYMKTWYFSSCTQIAHHTNCIGNISKFPILFVYRLKYFDHCGFRFVFTASNHYFPWFKFVIPHAFDHREIPLIALQFSWAQVISLAKEHFRRQTDAALSFICEQQRVGQYPHWLS